MFVIEVRELTKNFGGLRAVNHLDFSVQAGQIKALIGPNGAGKSTVFNLISGIVRPDWGRIVFNGVELDTAKGHERCRLGIGRAFQIPHMFNRMNVLENIMIGCHSWTKTELFANVIRSWRSKKEQEEIDRSSWEIIELLGLSQDAFKSAVNLSYGKQKMVAIGRAMASRPKLLLLDEPSTGLNEFETKWLAEILLKTREKGITFLLIEHDMGLVMEISDEIVVINYGTKIAEGSPDRIVKDEGVIAAYLGT